MNLFDFIRENRTPTKGLTAEQKKEIDEAMLAIRRAEEEKKYWEEVKREYNRIKFNDMTNNGTMDPKELAQKLYDLDNSKNC